MRRYCCRKPKKPYAEAEDRKNKQLQYTVSGQKHPKKDDFTDSAEPVNGVKVKRGTSAKQERWRPAVKYSLLYSRNYSKEGETSW